MYPFYTSRKYQKIGQKLANEIFADYCTFCVNDSLICKYYVDGRSFKCSFLYNSILLLADMSVNEFMLVGTYYMHYLSSHHSTDKK